MNIFINQKIEFTSSKLCTAYPRTFWIGKMEEKYSKSAEIIFDTFWTWTKFVEFKKCEMKAMKVCEETSSIESR